MTVGITGNLAACMIGMYGPMGHAVAGANNSSAGSLRGCHGAERLPPPTADANAPPKEAARPTPTMAPAPRPSCAVADNAAAAATTQLEVVAFAAMARDVSVLRLVWLSGEDACLAPARTTPPRLP
eukprot:CAMPEP_0170281916 /NCGR_PEP_ID=MMETSP0116_2-20130129/40978_1 /TAXON_ID=400756 /ORGANISM="Durinskia baltica, Strain CSIRO CS-38" /LENGTH=125 /DNA_ID=CAMNT_0010533259 /DNA_START=158 /DNA_END=532 /DNA_ORIENTATION=+